MQEFTTRKRNREQIQFSLDGRVYTFTSQKLSLAMLPLVDTTDDSGMPPQLRAVKSELDWLSLGLPDDEIEEIIGRLRDPDDDLELNDVTEVTKWLFKQVSGNPTGSPGGSGTSRTGTGDNSTDGAPAET